MKFYIKPMHIKMSKIDEYKKHYVSCLCLSVLCWGEISSFYCKYKGKCTWRYFKCVLVSGGRYTGDQSKR